MNPPVYTSSRSAPAVPRVAGPAQPAHLAVPRPAVAAEPAARAGTPVRVVAFPKDSRKNPHMRLLYRALQPHGVNVAEGSLRTLATGRYDVVHVHWPERILDRPFYYRWRGFARLLIEMALLRLKGARLVWTVQNIKSHEEQGGLLPRLYRATFFRALDGFISLSQTAHDLTLATFPALRHKPALVAPRGHYRDLYPDLPSRQTARTALDLPQDSLVLGMVGLIRPYKNIPHLLRCFRRLPHARACVLVAGECRDPALQEELEKLAFADCRVRLDFRFVPESELPLLVRALDLAVLPYREILNSGSALLALSLDVPVLAPAMGTLVEVQRAVGTAWVQTYAGDLDERVLADAVAWASQPRDGRAPLAYFDWESNARSTAAFFRSLLPSTRRA